MWPSPWPHTDSNLNMSDWRLDIIRWVTIVCGIAFGMLLVHSLVIYEFRRDAEGYIRLAMGRLKGFLLTVFVVEWVIGTFFFIASVAWIYLPYPVRLLYAVIVGMLSAFLPYTLEGAFLGRSIFFLRVRRALARLMRRLNLAVRYEFARAIAIYRERDVYDCQKDGWETGATRVEVGRRLRILYELSKEAIATERRDPDFLYYDEGRNPWEKFYLLVRFLGRDELRRRLTNPPPSPSPDWDGRERRLNSVRGSKDDRSNLGGSSNSQRCYDSPERIKRIRAGKSYFLHMKNDR